MKDGLEREEIKRQALIKLKEEHQDRLVQIEVEGGELTEEDIKRQEKIKQLEEETKIPTIGWVFTIGLGSMFFAGVAYVVGTLLSLTGIGIIIGAPMIILGTLALIVGCALVLIGITITTLKPIGKLSTSSGVGGKFTALIIKSPLSRLYTTQSIWYRRFHIPVIDHIMVKGKKIKIDARFILSWLVGGGWITTGTTEIIRSTFPIQVALSGILAGILLIPPSDNIIEKKFNIILSGRLKVLEGFLLFMVISTIKSTYR
jgi:hypothetical protein